MKCKINVTVTVENNSENASLAKMIQDLQAFCEVESGVKINNSTLSFESSGVIHNVSED